MKNREKRRRRTRQSLKDYLKKQLNNWKPKKEKDPISNLKENA